jgi:hypothetical protein
LAFRRSFIWSYDLEEVGAGAVHLVDERQTRHLVLVGLAPDGFRLGLHAAHGAVHHAGAVEHAHGTLHLDGEVHVAGGVDDVDAVLGEGHVHALPETGGGSGRDRDAALLLLLHPVHGGSAIVHFTNLVVHTGVEKNALGRGGLAGVDVRRNTNVAIALNGGNASHDGIFLKTAEAATRSGAAGPLADSRRAAPAPDGDGSPEPTSAV